MDAPGPMHLPEFEQVVARALQTVGRIWLNLNLRAVTAERRLLVLEYFLDPHDDEFVRPPSRRDSRPLRDVESAQPAVLIERDRHHTLRRVHRQHLAHVLMVWLTGRERVRIEPDLKERVTTTRKGSLITTVGAPMPNLIYMNRSHSTMFAWTINDAAVAGQFRSTPDATIRLTSDQARQRVGRSTITGRNEGRRDA